MQRMTRFRKLGLSFVAVMIVLFIGALVFTAPKMAVAIIDRGGGDNVAVAFNTRDDSSIFRSAFKITRTMSDTVDQQNAAIAYASCDSCQTVANATQVVLVMNDDVNNVSPTNAAIALNEECTDCETLASAYQKVLSTGGPVHFTPEGNRQIAELRQRYQELRNSGYTTEEMQTEFDAMWTELNDVLANELVPAGNSGDVPSNDKPEPTTPATISETAPAATESTSPEATPATTEGTAPEGTQPAPAGSTDTATSGGSQRRPANTPGGSKSATDPATSGMAPGDTTNGTAPVDSPLRSGANSAALGPAPEGKSANTPDGSKSATDPATNDTKKGNPASNGTTTSSYPPSGTT